MSEEVDFGVRFLSVEPGAFCTGLFNPDAAFESAAMPEYAGTVGATRDYLREGNGTQPGDPAQGARAILSAIASPSPPLRLVLGADAVERVRARLDSRVNELEEWEQTGRNTAIDTGER